MTNLQSAKKKKLVTDTSQLYQEAFLCEIFILTRSRPVFLTEASTVSLSHGISVFRSISSQEIPSWKNPEAQITNEKQNP